MSAPLQCAVCLAHASGKMRDGRVLCERHVKELFDKVEALVRQQFPERGQPYMDARDAIYWRGWKGSVPVSMIRDPGEGQLPEAALTRLVWLAGGRKQQHGFINLGGEIVEVGDPT